MEEALGPILGQGRGPGSGPRATQRGAPWERAPSGAPPWRVPAPRFVLNDARLRARPEPEEGRNPEVRRQKRGGRRAVASSGRVPALLGPCVRWSALPPLPAPGGSVCPVPRCGVWPGRLREAGWPSASGAKPRAACWGRWRLSRKGWAGRRGRSLPPPAEDPAGVTGREEEEVQEGLSRPWSPEPRPGSRPSFFPCWLRGLG